MAAAEQVGDEDVVGCVRTYCCCCFFCQRIKHKPSDSIIEPHVDDSTVICDQTTDRATLLAFMHIRYREKRASYDYCATLYRRLDTFCFFVPLMLLQCGVSVIYAVGGANGDLQHYFSGIASATSAMVIAFQNRFKFGEASKQFRNGARQYSLLAAETFTKWLSAASLTDQQFQQFTRDIGALQKEVEDTCPVPPNWVTTKFEKHRLILRPHQPHPNVQGSAPSTSRQQSQPAAVLPTLLEEGGEAAHDHIDGRSGFMGARLSMMQAARQDSQQQAAFSRRIGRGINNAAATIEDDESEM